LNINELNTNEREALNIPKPQSERLYEALKTSTGSSSTPALSSTPGSGQDQIDLGSQSELVTQTQNAGAADRASRIEQLRALVQSGQYQVDTAALSQSIVGATISGY
jgi:anti-sigma28 factor (negative regulator of flagellin synthesis)